MKEALLRSYAKSQKLVQLKFKHDPGQHGAPVGPGKIELVKIDADTDAGIMNSETFFKMIAPAMLGQQVFNLPIIFSADDILWLSEGPIDDEGKPVVVVPPKRPQTSGAGLHLPRG